MPEIVEKESPTLLPTQEKPKPKSRRGAHLGPWQFKKGENRKPSTGRPPGSFNLTNEIRKALHADGGKAGKAIIDKAIEKAKGGNFRYFKEIIDRIDGPILGAQLKPEEINIIFQQIVIQLAEKIPDPKIRLALADALRGNGEDLENAAARFTEAVH